MDEWMAQWEALTSQMIDHLEEADSESLLAFVKKRERLMEQLQSDTITEEQRSRWQPVMARMLQCDRKIVERMIELRDQSSRRIGRIESARLQKNTYESRFTPDSVFFDRKK